MATAFDEVAQSKRLAELVIKDLEVMLPNNSLGDALQIMAAQDTEILPVVNDIQERKVIGVVFHKDLVVAHNRLLTGK